MSKEKCELGLTQLTFVMAGFGYISIYKILIVITTGAAVRPFLIQHKTIYSKKFEISLCLSTNLCEIRV